MCGFLGVVRAPERGKVDASDLAAALPFLMRRGPDGLGVLVDGGIALAASRLAIQGGREGDQPLRSPDGRFALAYNGELFAEHRRRIRGTLRAEGAGEARVASDTALLLAWLAHRAGERRHGEPVPPDAFELLAGAMWAFAFVDLKTREVLLHSDGAVKPLHSMELPERGETWFASTLAPLHASVRCARRLVPQELARRLVLPVSDGTLATFAGDVRCVGRRPLLVDERTGAVRALPPVPAEPAGPAADADDVRDALSDAAREAGETAGPVSIFLSGGLDSAAVASWCGRRDALAVTGRFDPPGGPFDESFGARAVAANAGLRHEVVDLTDRGLLEDLPDVIDALEEPVGGPGSLALHRLAHRARAHARVALSGTGGDELLGGYARVALALDRSGPYTAGYESLGRRMQVAGNDPFRRWLAAVDRSADLVPHFSREFAASLPVDAARAEAWRDLFRPAAESGADPLRTLVRAEETTTLRMLLRVEDRVTMALGLESRPAPCLGRFRSVAARVPAGDLVGADGEGKRILRAALAGSIPESVRTDLRKRGFPTPFDRAARGAGRDLAEGLLFDRRFSERGWWDVAACRRLLEGTAPRPDHDRALFAVLSLETWARRFLDGDAFAAAGGDA